MDSSGQITFVFPLSDIKNDELRSLIDDSDDIMSDIGSFYVNLIGQMVVMRNVGKFFEYSRQ